MLPCRCPAAPPAALPRGTLIPTLDDLGPRGVGGRVERADGLPVDGGLVLVHFRCGDGAPVEHVQRAPLDGRGHFVAAPPLGWTEAIAHYLPAPGLADASSRPLRARARIAQGRPAI
ncbi:MAG: hypothetical protein JNK64_10955 [Myxococcales bacterium]|nr:hypothetical protein [Myxococcales bacterium]